jgi:hypothetical protein
MTIETATPTTAVAQISVAKNIGPCEGMRHIAEMKNTLVK